MASTRILRISAAVFWCPRRISVSVPAARASPLLLFASSNNCSKAVWTTDSCCRGQ